MAKSQKVPAFVAFGLAAAIVLDTGVQIFWKIAEKNVPENADAVQVIIKTVLQPAFLAVAVMFSLQLLNWLKVLEEADLSYAQPITSLSYISVCLLATFFLGEKLTILQLLGVLSILCGVWFISRTDHSTVKSELPAK